MNTQPILPEDHTQDQFIDKLEELCDCKGLGYIKALEKIVELKKENEELKKQLNKILHPEAFEDDEEYNPEEYGHCECCEISLTEDDYHNGEGKCEACATN